MIVYPHCTTIIFFLHIIIYLHTPDKIDSHYSILHTHKTLTINNKDYSTY